MGGGLLVPDQDVVDLRVLGQGVEQRQGRPARIGPDGVDPFADQTLPDDIGAGVLHLRSFLFVGCGPSEKRSRVSGTIAT